MFSFGIGSLRVTFLFQQALAGGKLMKLWRHKTLELCALSFCFSQSLIIKYTA